MTNVNKQRHDRVREEIERAQRRKVITANILAGATYREIAEALKVDPATVSREVKAIVKELNAHYMADADRWRLIQLRRYDVMLNAVWEDTRGGQVEGKVIKPNLPSIDRVLSIMDRQNRLLGLEKSEPIVNTIIQLKWPEDDAKPADDVAEDPDAPAGIR